MRIKVFVIFVIGMLLISACAQGTPTAQPTEGITQAAQTPNVSYPPPTAVIGGAYPPPTQSTGSAYPGPTQSPEPTLTTGTIKAAESAAIKAAAAKYGIPADQFTVVSTEAVTWPNGCLGVVIPGVMCTDALVDGYRVILEANGQQFEFRTNLDGTNVVDAAQLQATLQFVVSPVLGSLEIVNPSIPLGSTYNPSFRNFLPTGGSVSGTAYVIDSAQSKAFAIDASGSRELTFIEKPTYGLAVWNGGEGAAAMLAWGTQLIDDTHTSSLQISALDGSGLETLYSLDDSVTPPQALVAEFWSADGKSVYFSKEPVGIGGYIPYSGGSSLYKIDIASKEVTEIIPFSADSGTMTCLDAISGDYRYVAEHCTQGVITVRNLENGGTATIQPPAEATSFGMLGSARFSPNGTMVAFALSIGNPDKEQGWVAVSDSKGGIAKLILTSEAGAYYTVAGWLDDQTLLVQLHPIGCASCVNEIYTVSVDGSSTTKVAEAIFLTVIDNR